MKKQILLLLTLWMAFSVRVTAQAAQLTSVDNLTKATFELVRTEMHRLDWINKSWIAEGSGTQKENIAKGFALAGVDLAQVGSEEVAVEIANQIGFALNHQSEMAIVAKIYPAGDKNILGSALINIYAHFPDLQNGAFLGDVAALLAQLKHVAIYRLNIRVGHDFEDVLALVDTDNSEVLVIGCSEEE